jgi:Tetratricopeptide repeat
MHKLIRSGALACGVCLLTMGGVAFGARARTESAQTENNGPVIVALEEESIGGEDLTPASPTATPTAGEAGDKGAPASAATGSAGTGSIAPGAQPTPGGSAAAAGDESASVPTPTPAAEATDVPPAMDIGSLTPTMAVSDASLKPMIEKTTDPALAASLRITEKARVEIGEGHPEDAIRDLAHAVSIDPSNSYAYFFLGRAYAAKKDYEQAITFFKRAETSVGKNPAWLGETYAFEGLSYEESGKQVEAAAAYQKSLAATPGNLTARVGFTRLSAYLPAAPTTAPTTEEAQPAPAGAEIPPPPAAAEIPGPPESPAPSESPPKHELPPLPPPPRLAPPPGSDSN